jgi:hypothetical protein
MRRHRARPHDRYRGPMRSRGSRIANARCLHRDSMRPNQLGYLERDSSESESASHCSALVEHDPSGQARAYAFLKTGIRPSGQSPTACFSEDRLPPVWSKRTGTLFWIMPKRDEIERRGFANPFGSCRGRALFSTMDAAQRSLRAPRAHPFCAVSSHRLELIWEEGRERERCPFAAQIQPS